MHEAARRLAETEVDLPSQHVLVEGGAAAIRHEWEAGAGLLLEVDTGDLRTADANCPRGGLAGVLLQPLDEFLQVLCWKILPCNDPLRGVCQERHRFEILYYVILELIARTIE